MSADGPPPYSNPETTSVEPHFSFEGPAVPLPPGTKPPPRPPGKERRLSSRPPGAASQTELDAIARQLEALLAQVKELRDRAG